MNIFDSDCDALVNTINCVGVMGGGLAKQFRMRYPDMNHDYQSACARGAVKIGQMWNWHDAPTDRWIINFPTKDDWRNPSRIEYIEEGLRDLRKVIDDLGLVSIAIPALGCGLGGLEWNTVLPIMVAALTEKSETCRIDFYTPQGGRRTMYGGNVIMITEVEEEYYGPGPR